MKKTALFTAMALSAAALGGNAIHVEAAGPGQQGSYKNVIVIQGNGFSDLQSALDSLKDQFPGSFPDICRPVLPPCPPDINVPGTDTPDQPDNDAPDTDAPDGSDQPDNDTPGTDTPDGSDQPDNDIPDTDTPDGSDQPDNDAPDTDAPDGSDQPDADVPDKPQPGPDTDTPGTDEEAPDGDTQLTYAEQVVHLVNVERKKQGLSALSIREDVRAAAQVRAVEIQTSFSHTRPDGRSFSTALREQGVTYRGSGENIAWGQRSPQEVVTGWMNSEGHRANILNPNFTSIGVGHYQNAAGVNYWTQLFIY